MKKKFRKKLRVVKRFAVKFFGHRIVREVFGFILILGILYFSISGVLVLALRTETFWMAVVSNSMKHGDDSWRSYFDNENIRREVLERAGQLDPADNVDTFDTSEFPWQGGFERGDLLIIQGVGSPADVKVGDVIIIDRGPRIIPLVHRVFRIQSEGAEVRFTTKGDNNLHILVDKDHPALDDVDIRFEHIDGKVIFVMPWIGNLSLWWQGS